MNKLKPIYVFLILISALCLQAQNNQTFVSDLVDPTSANFSLIYGTEKIKGTPYYFEDWKKGEVLTTNGQKIAVDKMNIDVCSQKVVAVMNGKETWLNNATVIAVSIEEKVGMQAFSFIKTQNDKDEIVYAKIIAEGDYSVLGFPSKKFKKPQRLDDYNYGSRDVKSPFFTKLDMDYYLTYLNDDKEKIKLKNKDLEKKIQKKHQRLYKSVSKKADIDIKTEEDMAKFLEIFNKEVNQKDINTSQN
jgi:hypothetical protein